MEVMVNKPILLVAMLAMILLVAAPALTQTAPDIAASPKQATDAVQTAEDAAVDPPAVPETPATEPAAAPAGLTVGCELLNPPPPDNQCTVDANGEITLPDGKKAPVLVSPFGDVFVQDENGALTLVGTGASFITTGTPATGEAPATGEVQPAQPAA
jgi:hypothetical protein